MFNTTAKPHRVVPSLISFVRTLVTGQESEEQQEPTQPTFTQGQAPYDAFPESDECHDWQKIGNTELD
jgi:hypothetical protein